MNNFAISSGGVGTALLNSASALAAANNDLDQSIAMITAANTIVQDAAKVGTSLKTVSMYLRAAKTEAEEAGEATDGMASSVSELRGELLALTGSKVDIQSDDKTLKSTYQILKELASVWNDLSDISQANILEMIGGKRNSNVVSALLNNFELVDDVMEKTTNSTGSALAENEKYLDSINGKISIFQATFESLSNTVVNSEFFKALIDGGTGLISILDGVIGKFGILNTLIAGITASLSLKNIGKDKMFSFFEYTDGQSVSIGYNSFKLTLDAIH